MTGPPERSNRSRAAAPGSDSGSADAVRRPRWADRRLRRGQDFSAVMRKGRRARHRLLQLTALPNELGHNRFGFSVSRKVGKAVVRNRVKRRLRAILRDLPLSEGYDIVVTARDESAAASYQELQHAVHECARRGGLTRAEDARGPTRQARHSPEEA